MKLLSNKDSATIAIIQTAFIGDIALTLPFVLSLRNNFTDSNIIFITTPAGAELCSDYSLIDEVLVFDKRKSHKSFSAMREFASEIAKENIDYIFVPHKSFRTAVLVSLIRFFSKKIIISVGYKDNALSLLLAKRVKQPKTGHEIEKIHSLLKPFIGGNGYQFDKGKSYVEYIHPKVSSDELSLDNLSKTTIAIAPGSVWKTKRWGEQQYTKLAIMLKERGYDVVLIGGNDDIELCKRIAENSHSISLAGIHSLSQTVLVLSKALILISNDSAPSHLAYLAGCPVIMIYGPTVPEFGFYPLGEQSKVLQNNELKCRPCHHHGLNICPLGTHECMTSIDPITVLSLTEQTLRNVTDQI